MTEARKFYKFRPLNDKTISLILNNVIYFACAEQFNDPFDCHLRFTYDLTPAEWQTLLLELSRKHFHHLSEAQIVEMVKKRMEEKFYESPLFLDFLYDMVLKAHLPNVGILSLAGNCTSMLMWAHYADSHKGCCLEFSSNTDRVFANAQQVIYHKEYPKLDFKKSMQSADAWVEATILNKSDHWYYEQEWRTQSPDGPGLYEFKPESLTGIIMGYAMPQEQRNLLKRLVELRLPKVKLFRAYPKHREFEMEISPYLGYP